MFILQALAGFLQKNVYLAESSNTMAILQELAVWMVGYVHDSCDFVYGFYYRWVAQAHYVWVCTETVRDIIARSLRYFESKLHWLTKF